MPIPESVRLLERELRGVFGARLQALVMYGLRDSHHLGATRTMVLVESLTEQDLRGCAALLAAWHTAGLATPLIVPSGEFDRSLDVFPLEFSAIIADRACPRTTGLPDPAIDSSLSFAPTETTGGTSDKVHSLLTP